MAIIGDDESALADLLSDAIGRDALVLCSGGLGPTTDDVTARAVSRAFGVPLERNPLAEAQVEERFRQRGRAMAPINLKQADLPAGAVVLENPAGTAPAFMMTAAGTRAVFLPGPPVELQAVMDRHGSAIFPSGVGPSRVVLRCTGEGESLLQERMMPVETEFPGVRVSYRASFPEVSITLSSADPVSLWQCRGKAISAIGESLFSTDGCSLAERIIGLLAERRLTVATAESCTGGLISHLLTLVPGASACVRGAVVAYDNAIKTAALGVPVEVLRTKGAVSEETVCAMAQGARQSLLADIAIATSGIAGPAGGSADKPAGTVHIAVVHPLGILHRKFLFNGINRTRVVAASAAAALKMTLDLLENR
jgi:nicotinamide-nucleotide amidase